jgi:hypothetical protein
VAMEGVVTGEGVGSASSIPACHTGRSSKR